MFFEKKEEENLTLEEKVDFLYEKAKKDEKRRKRKIYYFIMILLLTLGYTYYFYMVFLPWLTQLLPFNMWWNTEQVSINNIIEGFKNIDVSKIEQIKDLVESWEWESEIIQIDEKDKNLSKEELLKKYLSK